VGVEWELGRTKRALAALGDPHRAFRSVHVGGTNGKGSVTATLASVFVAAGRRTGCYTSPHLCSFCERILVDGRPIEEETLVRYGEDVREQVVRCGLTFFEAATVLAFHAFREQRVEVAAVEVGLGGRLDATNVLVPEASAVTNVAMDHADYLGGTLQAIAREKAGIMKRGVPFVTAETDPEILSLFDALAGEAGTRVRRVHQDAARDVVVSRDHTRFRLATSRWGELHVVTPLVGRHQVANTALAIEVLGELPASLRPGALELLEGISRVRHRGRDEVRVIDGLTWVLDVAHNAAGVSTLVDTLERLELPRPLVLLCGILGDKDWHAMLPPLLARMEHAVLTVPPTAPAERRWDPRGVAAELGSGGRVADTGAPSRAARIEVEEDFGRALERARSRAGDGTVVVTGSVHTVGGAMRALGIDPLA
jgi:dihydrofolate synthase/folylpolyglutamate synthase